MQTDEDGEAIEVGRFRFRKQAFQRANTLLIACMNQQLDLIVIDEWGKLERKGLGLAPASETLLKASLTGKLHADLVVVVRDYLMEDFISYCKDLIPSDQASVFVPKILDLPRQ